MKLTAHQLSVLRDYEQLGTIAAVADFRGTEPHKVKRVLRRIRYVLSVTNNDEAVQAAKAVKEE